MTIFHDIYLILAALFLLLPPFEGPEPPNHGGGAFAPLGGRPLAPSTSSLHAALYEPGIQSLLGVKTRGKN